MLALAVAASALPVTAHAGSTTLPLLFKKKKRKKKKKKRMTPEKAAEQRVPVQEQGRQMLDAGELTAATILYDAAANTQGDPVLFLDAGETHLRIADEERDMAAAETAKMRGLSAQDILYYHLDSSSDPGYRVVADDEITGLLSRSQQLVDNAELLIAEIQAEEEALLAPDEPAKKKGDGRGLKLAGYGLIGLGVAGLGVGVAGLVLGGINQRQANDATVYGPAFDEVDAKGRRSNVIAGVGLAVGGVALATGVTLFFIGNSRKGNGSGGDEGPSTDDDASLAIVPTGRGLAITGRF